MENNKTLWPCVYCNKERYEQIKDKLSEWGYIDKDYNMDYVLNDWDTYPILVTHYFSDKKSVGNFNSLQLHQYLCLTIDDFLKEAKKVAIREGWYKEDKSIDDKFHEAAIPLIKFINENYHMNCKVIVTATGAELVEDVMGFTDYSNID